MNSLCALERCTSQDPKWKKTRILIGACNRMKKKCTALDHLSNQALKRRRTYFRNAINISIWIELSKYTLSHFDLKMVLKCWSLCNILIRCWAYIIRSVYTYLIGSEWIMMHYYLVDDVEQMLLEESASAAEQQPLSRVNKQKKNLFYFHFH